MCTGTMGKARSRGRPQYEHAGGLHPLRHSYCYSPSAEVFVRHSTRSRADPVLRTLVLSPLNRTSILRSCKVGVAQVLKACKFSSTRTLSINDTSISCCVV